MMITNLIINSDIETENKNDLRNKYNKNNNGF